MLADKLHYKHKTYHTCLTLKQLPLMQPAEQLAWPRLLPAGAQGGAGGASAKTCRKHYSTSGQHC